MNSPFAMNTDQGGRTELQRWGVRGHTSVNRRKRSGNWVTQASCTSDRLWEIKWGRVRTLYLGSLLLPAFSLFLYLLCLKRSLFGIHLRWAKRNEMEWLSTILKGEGYLGSSSDSKNERPWEKVKWGENYCVVGLVPLSTWRGCLHGQTLG